MLCAFLPGSGANLSWNQFGWHYGLKISDRYFRTKIEACFRLFIDDDDDDDE